MSKVVKGVGRAIGKVVKGVAKVAKTIVKSKIGKVIIAAAAIYFGGAALLGAMGTAGGAGAAATAGAAAGGGLSGAAAGISSAWSGLTGAVTGGGLSSLSGVFTGGSAAAPAAIPAAANVMGSPIAAELGTATLGSAAPASLPSLVTPAANAATKGLIGSSIWSSPYTAPALISSGQQLIGNLVQGVGAQKQQEHQEEMDAAARARYNTNIGTRLWA